MSKNTNFTAKKFMNDKYQLKKMINLGLKSSSGADHIRKI